MKEDIEEAIDREYKDLLEEYNSIIETIQDYDYSTDFRSKYLYKLNKLLDSPNRYTKMDGIILIWEILKIILKRTKTKIKKYYEA